MAEEATPLINESHHPHKLVLQRAKTGRRVVAMDSARYVDSRNRDRDVVVASSYMGVLSARLMAPHRPRAVIGHDGCILGKKDCSGIAGLWYLEALGIPAAAANDMTAKLGNGMVFYESGIISRSNVLAERCGVRKGMSVKEAAEILLDIDPEDITTNTKIIRHDTKAMSKETCRGIVVTDSVVFALPPDTINVFVTGAGHTTGRSGAKYFLEVTPYGSTCSKCGQSKSHTGISGLGLEITEANGLAGACCGAWSDEPIGDALKAYEEGTISACNAPAKERGVKVGMTARDAAFLLLQEDIDPNPTQ